MRPVILIWRPSKAPLWGPENFTTTDVFLDIPVTFTASEIFTFLDVDYYNQVPLNLDKNEILTFLAEDYQKPVPVSFQKSELLTFLSNDYLKPIPTSFEKTELSTFVTNDYLKPIPTSFEKTELSTFVIVDALNPLPIKLEKTELFCAIDINQTRVIPISTVKEEIFTFIADNNKKSISEFQSFDKIEIPVFLGLENLVNLPVSFNIESSDQFVSLNNFKNIPNQFNIESSDEFLSLDNLKISPIVFLKNQAGNHFIPNTTNNIIIPPVFSGQNDQFSTIFSSNDPLISADIEFDTDNQMSNSLVLHQKNTETVPASFSIPSFTVEIPPLSGPETISSTDPDLFLYKNSLHFKFEGDAGQTSITELTEKIVTSNSMQLTNATRFTNDQNNSQTKAALTRAEGAYVSVGISATAFIDRSSNTTLTAYGSPPVYDFGPFTSNLGSSVYFDGNGEYLITGYSAISITNQDTVTYEFWVHPKKTDFVYENVIFLNYYNSQNNKHYCSISAAGDSLIYSEDTSVSSTLRLTTPAGSLQNNAWSHVAIIRKPAAPYVKIFINGVLSAQTSTGTLLSANNHYFIIGGNSPTLSLRGYLSNFRVVNGVEVYTSNFVVPKRKLPVIAGTQLLALQDESKVLDLADKNFTIEGWWSPFRLSSGGALVGIWTDTTATSSWLVSQGSDPSQLAFSISDGSNVTSFEAKKDNAEHSSFSALGWYHWAIVRRNDMIQGFVNGKKISSFTGFFDGLINPPSTSLRVATISNNNKPSLGVFDDIRITRGIARYYDDFTPFRQTSVEPPILPLHLLHFDDTSSMQFIDEMQSNWTYHSVGSPASSATIVSNAAAFGSGGLSVAGGSGIKTTPNQNVLNSDFTIEAWIYPRSFNTGSVNTIISQDLTSVTGFTISITSSSATLSYHSDGNYTTATNFSANSWYHLAIQRKNSSHSFFINGKKYIPTGSGNRFSSATSTLYVGAYTASNVSFNGYIDELRISNFAKYTEDFNLPALAFSENINQEDIIPRNLLLYYDPSNSFSYDRNEPGVALNIVNDQTEMSIGGGHNFVHATSNAFSFSCSESDGTSTYVIAENIDIETTGDFTIEMWLKSDENSNCIYSYSSTNLMLPATISSNAPTGLPNVWDHIVLSRNSGVVSGYKNATLWGTGNDFSDISNIQFGSRTINSILDVGLMRVYNRSLALAEITQNYNAQKDRFYKPELIIRLEYEEFPNIFDTSAYNYPVNLIGSATITTTDYKKGLSSFYNPDSSSGIYFEKGIVKPLEIADFTFETWFKHAGSVGTQTQYIFCMTSDPTSALADASDMSVSLETVSGSLRPKFSVRNNGALTSVLSSNSAPPNIWNNLAVTRSGNIFRAFLNGTVFATILDVTTNFLNSSWHFGNFYKQVGGNRLGLNGRLDSTKLLKNSCLYTGDYNVPDSEVEPLEPLTLEGNSINDLDIFMFDQVGENSFFAKFTSPLDVKMIASWSDTTSSNTPLTLIMPDEIVNNLDITMTSIPASGENAVLTLFSPDSVITSSIDVMASSLPADGQSAVLTLFSPESSSPSELPVFLTR